MLGWSVRVRVFACAWASHCAFLCLLSATTVFSKQLEVLSQQAASSGLLLGEGGLPGGGVPRRGLPGVAEAASPPDCCWFVCCQAV